MTIYDTHFLLFLGIVCVYVGNVFYERDHSAVSAFGDLLAILGFIVSGCMAAALVGYYFHIGLQLAN